MKKRILFLSLISLLAIGLSISIEVKPKEAIADSPYQSIGTFYTYTRVSTTQQIIISESDIDFIEDAGRTVYFGPLNMQSSPDDSTDSVPCDYTNDRGLSGEVMPRYYYYATPNDGIINQRFELDNSIDSLNIVLLQLTQDAEFLLPNATNKQINNKILGYLRTINRRYTSLEKTFSILFINYTFDIFKGVCGNYDSSFISSIDSIYPSNGLRIVDYFASFVNSTDFNNDLHGTVANTYLNLNLYLHDDMTSNPIDLIHMFASIDGISLDTEETTGSLPYNYLANKNYYRNMISWGGDLQQACNYARNIYGSFSSFENILNGNYGYDIADFMADIDAINIATGLSLSNYPFICGKVTSYYGQLHNPGLNRYFYFKDNLISLYDDTGTNEEKFEYTVKHLVAVSRTDTDEYASASNVTRYKWYFLRDDSGTVPSLACRIAIAEMFIDYINSFLS